MHRVCVCVGGGGVCVRVCVRAFVCHTDFSKTTTATGFLCQLTLYRHSAAWASASA